MDKLTRAGTVTKSHKIAAFIRPIAHRGLHNAAQGIIENTTAAFSAAVTADYAIECDLQAARDGTPMVFHDDTIDRLIDGSGTVGRFMPDELRAFRYKNAADRTETMVSFEELLELVGGRVPLLVEIKNGWQPPHPRFMEQVIVPAKAYKGAIALQGYDPGVIHRVRLLAPDIPRGIVSRNFCGDGWWATRLSYWQKHCLSHLLHTPCVKPDFISYHLHDLPALMPLIARKVFKLPVFAWTVGTASDHAAAAKWADAPIFEGFRP